MRPGGRLRRTADRARPFRCSADTDAPPPALARYREPDEREPWAVSRRRRGRRRDPAGLAATSTSSTRTPASSGSTGSSSQRGLLQLRLRLHRGHPRRRRRPHRRPADHRRADVHRLPRLGPADRRPRDARREGLRLQGPVRRARRSHQAHIERLDQVRPHRLVEIEHFFADVQGCSRTRPSRSSAGARRDRALEVLETDRAAWRARAGSAEA